MAKAKAKPRLATRGAKGPYLAVAAFCESVLESKDGSLTPVRIIDQLTISLEPSAPPDFPSEEDKLPIKVWAVICIKTGNAAGEHELRLIAESPTGKQVVAHEQNIILGNPPQGGINLRLHQQIGVIKGGVFWLHVILDDKELTRMPLLIKLERQVADSAEPQASKPKKTRVKSTRGARSTSRPKA